MCGVGVKSHLFLRAKVLKHIGKVKEQEENREPKGHGVLIVECIYKSDLGHSRLMTMEMAAMRLYQNFFKFRYIEK